MIMMIGGGVAQMINFFSNLFNSEGWPPRKFCGNWDNGLISLHIISDAMIFLSYMAIPSLLAYFIIKNKTKFSWIVWLFVAFIFSCGLTHLSNIVMFFSPMYRMDGLVKSLTGLVSLATVIALAWLVPRILPDQKDNINTAIIASREYLGTYLFFGSAIGLLVFLLLFDVSDLLLSEFNFYKLINSTLRFLAIIITFIMFVSLVSQSNKVEYGKQKLEKSEEQFRVFAQSARDGVILIDNNSKVIFWNKGAEQIFGYTEDEILNKSIIAILPEQFREAHLKGVKRYLKTGESKIIDKTIELEGLKKDGNCFPLELSLSVVNTEQGKLFSGIVRDITRRRKLEDNLRKSNTELEQFAYIASHDLKAPLRAIFNLSEWIKEDLKDKNMSENSQRYFVLIQDRIKHMNALIEGILQYSKIGKFSNNKELIDLNKLVTEIIEGLEKKKFVFTVMPLPPIIANQTIISQLFQNLLNNTIKHHNRDDGNVSITVEDKGNFYQFAIEDDGPGIDPAFIPKLFNMFQTYQVPTSESTGIGLALCKKIVIEGGGNIWAESEAGKGAKFVFTWSKN